MDISMNLRRESGFQFVMDSLDPICPFGAERVREPHFYSPEEESALALELWRVRALLGLPEEEFTREKGKIDLCLMRLKDIRGTLRRCRGGAGLDLVELFEMKSFMMALRELAPRFNAGLGRALSMALHPVEAPLAILDPAGAGKRSFSIDDAATPALFALRREKRELEGRLFKTEDEAERTRLRLRRETVCAAEEAETRAVCEALSAALAPHCGALLENAELCGDIDILLRKALMCRAGAVVPGMSGGELRMEGMTVPEIARRLEAAGRSFVPVSIRLSRGAAVITGANMGGKSVALKALAQNALLFMAGFPVYAQSASVPVLANIILLAGDAQETGKGLSSFGGEVVRLRDAVAAAGGGGLALLLIDEPAKGTNPDEGAAIVKGLTRYLSERDVLAVITTHYDGVSELATRHYRVVGLRDMDREAVRAELAVAGKAGPEVIARHMDYGLYEAPRGAAGAREALEICRLLALEPALMEEIEKFY